MTSQKKTFFKLSFFDPRTKSKQTSNNWLSLINTNISIVPLQIYNLGKDTVVLLLESNPDIGHLLEWVIDRCYTAMPREADACFLSLATIFNVRLVYSVSSLN